MAWRCRNTTNNNIMITFDKKDYEVWVEDIKVIKNEIKKNKKDANRMDYYNLFQFLKKFENAKYSEEYDNYVFFINGGAEEGSLIMEFVDILGNSLWKKNKLEKLREGGTRNEEK